MRPRYLEVEGLQSFKELQRVDFDRLSETGLFGIFGPTGSGKSTILDAITLALYGSVHRAAKGTQGIINTDMSGIKVSFTFDLVKEGVRKTYRVDRQYKRKKDSENSAEAKIVRLIELQGELEHILADKHNEVNNSIVQLVGLKFEDFTRSVVLPQNKFQEFLLSPRGEKTKMLERIFYLEEYGRRLVDKVNRTMSAVKNKLSNLEGAISTLGIASPEALIESERRMMEATAHKREYSVKLKTVEEAYTAGLELYKLSKEYEELAKQLEEYNHKEPEIYRLQESCLRSEAANTVKPILKAYMEAKDGYEKNNEELELIEEQLKTSEAEKNQRQQAYEEALQLKDAKLPELIKYKTLLQECQTLLQEVQRLNQQLNEARKAYEQIKVQLEQGRKASTELIQQRDGLSKEIAELERSAEEQLVDSERRRLVAQGAALEKELQTIQLAWDKQSQKLKELQESSAGYESEHQKNLQELELGEQQLSKLLTEKAALETGRPINREEIAEKQGSLSVLEGQLQGMLLLEEAIVLLDGRALEYTSQQKEIEQELSTTAMKLDALLLQQSAEENKLRALQQLEKQHRETWLAKSLISGEKCPVCGSIEHPEPAAYTDENTSLEQDIKMQEEAFARAQNEIREQEHQLIKLRQQLSSLQSMQEQAKQEKDSKLAELLKQKEGLPERFNQRSLPQIFVCINIEKQDLEAAGQSYAEWEQSLQQMIEVIRQQENHLSQLKIQQSRLTALLDNVKATELQEQKQLQEQKETQAAAYFSYSSLQKQLTVNSFLAETELIAQRDEKAQKLSVALKEKRSQLDQTAAELESVQEQCSQINDKLNEKKSEGLKLKEQKEDRERKINSIIGSNDLSIELEKTAFTINKLEEDFRSGSEELNKARAVFEEKNRHKSVLRSNLEYFKTRLEAETLRLKEILQEKGFGSQAEAETCMLEEETAKQYQEVVAKHFREKGTLEHRSRQVETQLEGKRLPEEQWQQLCSEYELAKTEFEGSIAQLEAAKSNYLLIKDSFERWLKLQEELKAVSRRKDMLEQIQKLLKGNGFIEFISEERMRYIAREASVTLGELTKFRYSIELDTENGFVIRDNTNGGVLRSVASLSGGETFLTSLSLALALSSQLQLKGQSPLEFFFLDEGFGTLDNTLLDTVIDSLERLSSQKRVIGLISHVPEMKSRINRRLIVDAPDKAGTGSRIHIEKA